MRHAPRHALLACFAHPDDETFAVAGTLARCRRAGIPVALWTATDGEAGSDNRRPLPPAELARRRRVELLRAAGVIGIDRLYLPGFPDGGLAAHDPAPIRASLASAIREVRPTVLLTFGPEGAPNTHADHRVVSTLVTERFAELERAGGMDAPARLFYVTWPDPAPDAARPARGVAITCRIDIAELLPLKRRAFAEHATQQHHRENFERDLRPTEEYGLAAGVPQRAGVIDDLFAGL